MRPGLWLIIVLVTQVGCRRAASETRTATVPPEPPVDVQAAASRPRPRVLLTPDRVAALRTRAKAGDPEWRAIEARAKDLLTFPIAPFSRHAMPSRTITYAYQGFGWLEAALPLGIAYQVTRDPRYAAKLRDLLALVTRTTAAGDLSPMSIDAGYPSRTAALAVAIAYDWAHDAMDPAIRTGVVETANRWFDWNRAHAFERDGPAYGNYFGGHLLGIAAMGWATLGDNPRAPELVHHADRLFDAHVRPAFRDGGFAGGFPVEGYVYGVNHFVRLFQYMDLVRTATGKAPRELDDWALRCARNLIWNVKPNGWQVPDEAAYAGDTTGLLSDDLPQLLASVLGGKAEASALRRLLRERSQPPVELPRDALAPAWRLLLAGGKHDDTAPPPREHAFHSPGDERLVVRSGWGRDAVWGSLNGGLSVWAGHQAKTAGHLAIQRGDDYLLVFAGQWKGTSGRAGQPQVDVLTSDAANALYAEDGGRYLMKGDNYRGGQTTFARSRPYAWAAGDGFAWARLDLTEAYDRRADQRGRNPTVRTWTRDMAWIAPGVFVLFDHVATSRAADIKRIRFHFHHDGPPRIDGRDVTSVVGGSRLALRVLLPDDPEITSGWVVAKDAPLVPRIELSDRRVADELHALTVLQALPRDASVAPTTLVRSPSATGARVGSDVVVFARDESVRYEATGERHLIVGLVPTIRYAAVIAGGQVTLTPTAQGMLTTDARGVLRFAVADKTISALPGPVDGRSVSSAD